MLCVTRIGKISLCEQWVYENFFMQILKPTKKHLITWLSVFIASGLILLVIFNRGENNSFSELIQSTTNRNLLEVFLLLVNSYILSYFISLVPTISSKKDDSVSENISAVQIGDMVKISYDKLVRDLIPEHLASNGVEFKTHIADDIEYEDKLFAKLKEEASELAKDKNIDEVADVLEVVDAICAYKGFSKKEIELRRLEKFEKKGGFSNKIILEETLN